MSDDSVCIGHEPCPKCGSRDNLGRYSDGHGFCFGCGYHEAGNGEPTPRKSMSKSSSADLIDGEVKALAKRGITEETCRKWGYKVGKNAEGKTVQIANYCDESGRPIAQKVRGAGKTFKFLGDTKHVGLYGQWLWRDGGKMVVVTEGEIDALSVSQLQGNKWPVVSIPNGAQGAAKAIAGSLEWLSGFEKVVLMFDADEPGINAAAECAPILPPGKAFIAHIDGFKDANAALTAGKGSRVVDAIWSAKEYRPDGIVDIESVIERASSPTVLGLPWPWEPLTKATYGRRRGELYGFGGGTGIGKTTTFKMVQAYVLEHDKLPIGVFALEEPVHHSAKTLAGVIDGVRYHVPGEKFDPKRLLKTLESLKGRVYFYDHFGSATWETIKEKMRYMAHAFGVKDFFLDHLTALAATLDEDERKAIDVMMAELSALTLELDCTIYYVSHLSTPEGKSHEEGGRVMERHFRGSRAIGYWSHFLFALERDKQDVDGVTTFRVLKDRYTGDATGLTFGLRYNRETGRQEVCDLPSGDHDNPFPADEESAF